MNNAAADGRIKNWVYKEVQASTILLGIEIGVEAILYFSWKSRSNFIFYVSLFYVFFTRHNKNKLMGDSEHHIDGMGSWFVYIFFASLQVFLIFFYKILSGQIGLDALDPF